MTSCPPRVSSAGYFSTFLPRLHRKLKMALHKRKQLIDRRLCLCVDLYRRIGVSYILPLLLLRACFVSVRTVRIDAVCATCPGRKPVATHPDQNLKQKGKCLTAALP